MKMLSGLVRLDALWPEGFTAIQFAEHATVEPETARAFLSPSKGPGYAEVISGGRASASGSSGGRPPNLYRVRPERRADLLAKLVELRQSLEEATAIVAPSEEQLFSPIALLETTINELELLNSDSEEWRYELAAARQDLNGCEADLRALEATSSPLASKFALRLGAVQGRLAAIERMRQPSTTVEVEGDRPLYDAIAQVVKKFGSWLGEAPQALEPVLVLLDGIRGHDPITTALVKACQGNMRVAAFNVANMENLQRAQLYAAIDCLRGTSPLAASQMVLTLEGQTMLGRQLASEFRDLGEFGKWQKRVPAMEPALSNIDLHAMRHFYLVKGKQALEASQTAAFATRVMSALSAFEAADAADAIPRLPFADASAERERLLSAAQSLLGNAICIDAEHSAEVEKTFVGASVSYLSSEAIEALSPLASHWVDDGEA